MAKILVVDDEKLIVKGIRFSLMQDGYEVDTAYDGEEALDKARNSAYDVVLLDVMLPKLNGFEVCQQIREFSDMPIIMLTAKGEDMDKILGLDYGADDYITKPFNILEVKARIKAIMRRTAAMKRAQAQTAKPRENVLTSGDLKLDCDNRRLYIAGREINLTSSRYWSFLSAIPAESTAGRSCSLISGARIFPETCVRWMCISGVFARKSSKILPNRAMCRQSGESGTISASSNGKLSGLCIISTQ